MSRPQTRRPPVAQSLLICLALLALAACETPGEVPRLSDVDLDESAGQSAALPSETELSDAGGFLDSRETPAPRAKVQPKGGLLGWLGGQAAAVKGNGPDAREVTFGTSLPYGEIARVCGVSTRRLGAPVAQYPETRRGYVLYDSHPGSSSARALYITGFDDGCARQVTGALALFGDPELHEQLRYGLAGRSLPRGRVAGAYEEVKAEVCGVSAGRPCGRAMTRLARDTAFVSVYPAFGSTSYVNMLLHGGQVIAIEQH
ncbi:hypothetical protein [Alloyangia pacifica]|uniref:Lipoprotein n=1 Tax=Alloyangia pacifica TaxID=311180 RepID=A0A1I6RTG7_9RHOB|nr:hypothetical protein [Alloyangia pacifica]SDG60067.1 hypothetical protein SAMN04488245_103353 [Alloyangia pacifica]SFS68019.1 hypothetical protein SAMN04488050_103397 [Alloyangia pacifica]